MGPAGLLTTRIKPRMAPAPTAMVLVRAALGARKSVAHPQQESGRHANRMARTALGQRLRVKPHLQRGFTKKARRVSPCPSAKPPTHNNFEAAQGPVWAFGQVRVGCERPLLLRGLCRPNSLRLRDRYRVAPAHHNQPAFSRSISSHLQSPPMNPLITLLLPVVPLAFGLSTAFRRLNEAQITSLRSFSAGRLGCFQTLHSSEAQHDARGAGQTRSAGQRALEEFWHSQPKAADFWHSFGPVRGLSHDQSADDNDGNAGRKRVRW